MQPNNGFNKFISLQEQPYVVRQTSLQQPTAYELFI
jgi:hypothetical protein